ncbi:PIG-L family deacetylase [Streptomyces sp. NBC_01498]|uniref:PIG-L deacetylase family protein n=1 Tax=Streptomyces sp. NBC_01498 TaxID=2975870 RepID=UPI002E7BCBCC|nr:PIG-L family deacetylase [Streptomyces sp. NBC_01498]WTL28031.1 PIG-L family deacetylase [Streptomyces sp. NBC_01498]
MTPHAEGRPVYADPIQAPGTDEELWRSWPGWEGLPDFRLPTSGRVVVVAAHPDDEVLGAGGTIALLRGAGAEVTVVSVTDGERSHAASGRVTPAGLAGIRSGELRDALSHLGGADVVALKVPDTEVARHEDRVRSALGRVLAGARLCLAPWTGDVHGDHEAAGRAALAASRDLGVSCAMYPVWMWHWARPGDPRVPWGAAARVRLSPDVLRRKRLAVGCFVSQTEPLGPLPEDAAILPPDELAHHLRPFEVVLT